MKEALLATRARWLKAYFDGNVDLLDTIEPEHFGVVSGVGAQLKHEQLEHIAASVAAGNWFPAGSYAEDIKREVHILGDAALIRGTGCTVTPRRSSPTVYFTEVWQEAGGEWRPVHLHYSEVAHASTRAAD